MEIMNKTPLLTVACIVYNQERFIRDAVEGFLIQKTTFPIEIIIHDDASTDKTADIIREYAQKHPDLIVPIYQQENQYSKGVKSIHNFVFPKARGKYIALCEGDDYWTDPNKLQKQVDFLEANPDYGMVHSDCDFYFQTEKWRVSKYHDFINELVPAGMVFEQLLVKNFIVCCTSCIRGNILKKYSNNIFEEIKHFPMGDYPIWLDCAKHFKIGYINESLAVYRVTSGTASRPNSIKKRFAFEVSAFDIRKLFIEKYGCSITTRQIVANNFQKERLKYAFLFRDSMTAKEVFFFLKKQKIFLHRDYYIYYIGSLNSVTRIFAKFYFFIIYNKRKFLKH